MFLSMKYVIMYTGAGAATGFFSKSNKKAAGVGLLIAAVLGSRFGASYALVSAIEFGAGFFIASLLQGTPNSSD